jgi:DNA-binding LacI/PurR family transcriptional regulator
MSLLLDRFPDLDGVFAANDLMAVGALGVLRERGRRVPDDVAVVGYDDIPLASATSPPLTTVHQPLEELGRRMATALVRALDGPPGGDPAGTAAVVQAALGEPLQTRLVVRGSA